MKNKTSLVLLEQVMMVLVFALAAAICLQAFALSDRISAESEWRDRAVLQAQNTVEVVKDCGGDLAQAVEKLGGAQNGDTLMYTVDGLTVSIAPTTSEAPLLGTAQVTVTDAEGAILAELPAAWQEVGEHG